MPNLVFAFACLACVGNGRRVQPMQRLQNSQVAEPAAAFNPSGAGARSSEHRSTPDDTRPAVLNRGKRVGNAPAMGMSSTLARDQDQHTYSGDTSDAHKDSPGYELIMNTPAKSRARVDRIHTPHGILDKLGFAPLGAAHDPSSKASLTHMQPEEEMQQKASTVDEDRLRLQEIFKKDHKSTKVEGNQRQSQLSKTEEFSAVKQHPTKDNEQLERGTYHANVKIAPNSDNDVYAALAIASIMMTTALTFAFLTLGKKDDLHAGQKHTGESDEPAQIEEDVLERGQSVYKEARMEQQVTSIFQHGKEPSAQADVEVNAAVEKQVAGRNEARLKFAMEKAAHQETKVVGKIKDLISVLEEDEASTVTTAAEATEDGQAAFRAAFTEAWAAAERKAAANAKRDLLRFLSMQKNSPRRRRRLRLLQMLRRMHLRLRRVQLMQRQRMYRMRQVQGRVPKPMMREGGGRVPPVVRNKRTRQTRRHTDDLLKGLRLFEKMLRSLKRTRRR